MITPPSLHRREYKYLIDEDTAERIRRYICGFCAVDEYAERTGGRYLTDTLYLDTPDLASYRATVENAGDRYKLRIRSYPSLGGGPAFLEVKRRISETILKTRGAYRGDCNKGSKPDDKVGAQPAGDCQCRRRKDGIARCACM